MEPGQLQRYLDVTSQIFRGELSRNELSKLDKSVRVFVGTALMVLFREHYLTSGNIVAGPRGVYGDAIRELVAVRSANDGDDGRETYAQGAMHDPYVLNTAVRLGLYERQPGRGGIKHIRLQPPPEMVRLVRKFGVTPAIQLFMAEAGLKHISDAALAAHLEEYLAITRKVFEGSITRKQVTMMHRKMKVFVGTAILLAFRDHYLNSDNTVRGTKGEYGRLLYRLTNSRETPEADRLSTYDATPFAATLGLHVPASGSRNGIIVLCEPPPLRELVTTCGITDALKAFMVEAGEELALIAVPKHSVKDDEQEVEAFIKGVIATTQERYGQYGLQRLRQALNE
jgi:hypothetical protein